MSKISVYGHHVKRLLSRGTVKTTRPYGLEPTLPQRMWYPTGSPLPCNIDVPSTSFTAWQAMPHSGGPVPRTTETCVPQAGSPENPARSSSWFFALIAYIQATSPSSRPGKSCRIFIRLVALGLSPCTGTLTMGYNRSTTARNTPMTALTWLHLSDLHFKKNADWRQNSSRDRRDSQRLIPSRCPAPSWQETHCMLTPRKNLAAWTEISSHVSSCMV